MIDFEKCSADQTPIFEMTRSIPSVSAFGNPNGSFPSPLDPDKVWYEFIFFNLNGYGKEFANAHFDLEALL